MKLYSWNVNGIRSVLQKGLGTWLDQTLPQIACFQEVKALEAQVQKSTYEDRGYQAFWNSAIKPGYAGVSTWINRELAKEVRSVIAGIGHAELDAEGRVLTLLFDDWALINAYFPNSQREHTRLPQKLEFCSQMEKHLSLLQKKGLATVVCGDFNIAHKPIDLKNPKSNENNAGYLPEERAWLDHFTGRGYIDTFREFQKDPGYYTWWSYRPGVRQKNIGWRLDYFFADSKSKGRIQGAGIHPEVLGSDHCPVSLDWV